MIKRQIESQTRNLVSVGLERVDLDDRQKIPSGLAWGEDSGNIEDLALGTEVKGTAGGAVLRHRLERFIAKGVSVWAAWLSKLPTWAWWRCRFAL